MNKFRVSITYAYARLTLCIVCAKNLNIYTYISEIWNFISNIIPVYLQTERFDLTFFGGLNNSSLLMIIINEKKCTHIPEGYLYKW